MVLRRMIGLAAAVVALAGAVRGQQQDRAVPPRDNERTIKQRFIQPPRTEVGQQGHQRDAAEPLVDSELIILEGVIHLSRTVSVAGIAITVPEGCGFVYTLPPDKRALHWRQLGPAVIDKKNNKCNAAFEVGAPARFAQAEMGKTAITAREMIYTNSSGYFKMWWEDPIGLTVNWAEARINWAWQGPLFCSDYQGGAYNDWWLWVSGWAFLDRWNVGSVTGDCNLVGYTGSTLLMNNVFPPCSWTDPMFLIYDPVQTFGANDGYLYGYGHTEAWGGACFRLLTPHAVLVRTEN